MKNIDMKFIAMAFDSDATGRRRAPSGVAIALTNKLGHKIRSAFEQVYQSEHLAGVSMFVRSIELVGDMDRGRVASVDSVELQIRLTSCWLEGMTSDGMRCESPSLAKDDVLAFLETESPMFFSMEDIWGDGFEVDDNDLEAFAERYKEAIKGSFAAELLERLYVQRHEKALLDASPEAGGKLQGGMTL